MWKHLEKPTWNLQQKLTLTARTLAHHGQLSAGGSVEEASVLAYNFKVAARLQLLAMAAGEIRPLDPGCAKDAHDFLLKRGFLNAAFLYQARMRLRQGENNCLD